MKIAGTAHIKIDGVSYSSSITEGYSIKIQTNKPEPIMADDGGIHYKEVPVADTISGTLLTTGDFDPMVIVNARNATVQVQLNNGKTAILRNAMFSGDPEIDTMTGTFKCEWSGIGKWI
jgi:hypothetical protein